MLNLFFWNLRSKSKVVEKKETNFNLLGELIQIHFRKNPGILFTEQYLRDEFSLSSDLIRPLLTHLQGSKQIEKIVKVDCPYCHQKITYNQEYDFSCPQCQIEKFKPDLMNTDTYYRFL